MKPFQGFNTFDAMNTFSQGATPVEEAAPASANSQVFQQMLQQMMQHQTTQKSHSRNIADNLWLMGQGHTK